MKLKEFVKETLLSVYDGVEETYQSIVGNGGKVILNDTYDKGQEQRVEFNLPLSVGNNITVDQSNYSIDIVNSKNRKKDDLHEAPRIKFTVTITTPEKYIGEKVENYFPGIKI